MNGTKHIFLLYLLAVLYNVDGITLPPEINDTAQYAEVTASSTCQSNDAGFTCQSNCPSRIKVPDFETPLKEKGDSCSNITDADINTTELQNAEIENGNVHFDETTGNCTSLTVSTNVSSTGHFTLSMWVKSLCSDCPLFSIGSNFTVKSDIVPVNSSWTHVAVQYNGDISIFVSGDFVQTVDNSTNSTNFADGYDVTFGKVAAAGKSLSFVDLRWYAEVLTDREISKLATGVFKNVSTSSDCRCPPNAPSLVEPSGPYPWRYLVCTNRVTNETAPRLGSDAHPPEYMMDGDDNTHWNSGNVTEVTLTLNIGKLFQISRVILNGLQNMPNSTRLQLQREGKTIQPESYMMNITTGTTVDVSFNSVMEELTLTSRAQYEQTLADEIQVTFYSGGNTTFFTVSEFKIVTRCACYGNDDICSGAGLNYTCACAGSTSGDQCDSCVDEYFRDSDELDCPNQCSCNLSGAENNSCEPIGGQCLCKPNVADTNRTCTDCKYNTVRLGNDAINGCSACSCNPAGIVECMDNMTCVCKKNVESDTGNCTDCLPDHYGIDQTTGCKECQCGPGTMQSGLRSCDDVTGQCHCKDNVQGRTCDECEPSYRGLSPEWPDVCVSCKCSFVGSENINCNPTGQCLCQGNVTVNLDCRPAELNMEPDYGPIAGGTRVSIRGHNMGDITTTVSVNIGTVHLIDRSPYLIVFSTRPSAGVTTSKVTVLWKNGTNEATFEVPTTFRYLDNPDVTPPTKSFKTFASGGCSINIAGVNMDNIPHPLLLVHPSNGTVVSGVKGKHPYHVLADFRRQQYTELDQVNLMESATPRLSPVKCVHSTDTEISCTTPDVTAYLTNGSVPFGIGLDNIQDYENFAVSLVVVPDPIIETNQTASFRNTFDKEITITGRRLDDACADSDIRIKVGDDDCKIVSRSATTIRCDPGEQFPGTSRDEDVMVTIGDKTVYWGKVSFTEFWKLREFIYICVGCGGFILLIILLVVLCCWCRRRRRQIKKIGRDSQIELVATPPGRVPSQMSNSKGQTNPVAFVTPLVPVRSLTPEEVTDQFLQRLQPNVAKSVKSSIIDVSQIQPARTCTYKGQHVRVINGNFRQGSTSTTPVTIKTLIAPYPEDGALPNWLNNGLLESVRLRDSVHVNLLRLLGVTIGSKHIYLIYPEMANRTLKDYLQNQSKTFDASEKLSFCVQLGEGMNFLDADNLVHKDLAARNCWVDSNGSVKIADGSFSHDLYPDDYLYQNDRYQPVRWMAPESLKQSGFYHAKSDVWSYGVLMWEVFTNGYIPYHDVDNNDEITYYVCEKGYRLDKPHDCSDDVFSVIAKCHSDISDDRPNFFLILTYLAEATGDVTPVYKNDYHENRQSDLYINVNTKQLPGAMKLPPVPPRPQKAPPAQEPPRKVPPRVKAKPIRQMTD